MLETLPSMHTIFSDILLRIRQRLLLVVLCTVEMHCVQIRVKKTKKVKKKNVPKLNNQERGVTC